MEYLQGQRFEGLIDTGHINLYLRQPTSDMDRKSLELFRIPVAHFRRDGFGML